MDRVWEVAVVGAGDMGHALASYQGFIQRGFHIAMIFDNDPAKIGTKIGEYTILSTESMKDEIQKAGIKMAMSNKRKINFLP